MSVRNLPSAPKVTGARANQCCNCRADRPLPSDPQFRNDKGPPASFHSPAALPRGPNHVRIIAIGSAGQNISGNALAGGARFVGGATPTGMSPCLVSGAATFGGCFLRKCRRLAGDLPAFFADAFGGRFLPFRIRSCHL
jgi:hypothetical protein